MPESFASVNRLYKTTQKGLKALGHILQNLGYISQIYARNIT